MAQVFSTAICDLVRYNKHHNNKISCGISPSGFITFLSNCYGGRKADKNLEQDDKIMDDQGFTITILHHCHLVSHSTSVNMLNLK